MISVDQSTQGTKALLFDREASLIGRCDLPHRQIINERGWVSHDLNEIWHNTLQTLRTLISQSGIDKNEIAALGISNQRETTALWNKRTGEPMADAVVWQCARAEEICRSVAEAGHAGTVLEKTGIPLSGFFPAAKMAWLLEHTEGAKDAALGGELCLGTIDAWLVYKLTRGAAFYTDYSNASRTQLFNLETLRWDKQLCDIFHIPVAALPKVMDSDACFGYTDLEGFLEQPIPIHGVLGDSHGALFGQGCVRPGMIKATCGTGSSLMMNIGGRPVKSEHGVVTSIAWGRGGVVSYCLEGNLNYTGATISWLKNDLGLIERAGDTEELAYAANQEDQTYIVPAFTGLGAPYWDPDARAAILNISRTTGKKEIVRAALESIAYQITDLILAMEQDTGVEIGELRVDGGPSRNSYLMQFLSDISGKRVCVPEAEELSGIGAAYTAGIAAGLYEEEALQNKASYTIYEPQLERSLRETKYRGWRACVDRVLSRDN